MHIKVFFTPLRNKSLSFSLSLSLSHSVSTKQVSSFMLIWKTGKQKHREDNALLCITYQTRADPRNINLLAKSSNALTTLVLLSLTLTAGCLHNTHTLSNFIVSCVRMYQRCLVLPFFQETSIWFPMRHLQIQWKSTKMGFSALVSQQTEEIYAGGKPDHYYFSFRMFCLRRIPNKMYTRNTRLYQKKKKEAIQA